MRIALACLVLLAACSKKERDKPPEPPPPARDDARVASADARAPADARLPEPTPLCGKLLPKPIRDRYFAGATITAAPPSHGGEKCQIKLGDQLATLIEAACSDNVKAMKDDMIKSFRNTYETGTRIPDVGAPALVATMDNGQTVVYAWNADSSCVIAGELPKGIDPALVLKDWLALLPPP